MRAEQLSASIIATQKDHIELLQNIILILFLFGCLLILGICLAILKRKDQASNDRFLPAPTDTKFGESEIRINEN